MTKSPGKAKMIKRKASDDSPRGKRLKTENNTLKEILTMMVQGKDSKSAKRALRAQMSGDDDDEDDDIEEDEISDEDDDEVEGKDQRENLPKFGGQHICHHELATLAMLIDMKEKGYKKHLGRLEKEWQQNPPKKFDRPSVLRTLAAIAAGCDKDKIKSMFVGAHSTYLNRISQLQAVLDRAKKWKPDILPGDQLVAMVTLIATNAKPLPKIAKRYSASIDFVNQCEREVKRVIAEFGITDPGADIASLTMKLNAANEDLKESQTAFTELQAKYDASMKKSDKQKIASKNIKKETTTPDVSTVVSTSTPLSVDDEDEGDDE